MDPWYKKLLTENIWGVAVKLAMFGGGVGSAVIFPWILGAEGFGYYSVVFALANMWVFLASFSLDTTAVKFVSAGIVKGNVKSYVGFFVKTQLVLALSASALLYLLSDLVALHLLGDATLSYGVRVSALYVFFYSLFVLLGNLFVGLQMNRKVLYSYTLYHSLRIIFSVLLVFLFHDYVGVILGTSIAGLLSILLLLYFLGGVTLSDKKSKLDFSGIKRYTFYGSFGYLGVLLLQWISSLIIGVYDSTLAAGFYRIGFMWVSAIGLLIPISSKVLFSFFSETHERHEKEKIESIFAHSLKYCLVFSLLAILGLTLASDIFIKLVYGAEFLPAASALFLLSFIAIE
ncbi:MAG: oligosaccharide flippase family protein, partial [Candidatus Altiarchaeota archaeon]